MNTLYGMKYQVGRQADRFLKQFLTVARFPLDFLQEKAAVVVGDKLNGYKRLLSKIIKDGEDCNPMQIKLGMAWHYKKYERTQLFDERISYARE